MPGMRATMKEFGAGKLHSGSKSGPVVKSRKQAIAIGLSEQRGSPKSPDESMARRKNQGNSYREVASEHGVSKSTAHRRLTTQGYQGLGSAR